MVSLRRRLRAPCGHRQEMEVVVAQQAARGGAVADQPVQDAARVRPPVDQVAEHEDRVAAGREAERVEQAAQGGIATLHIADTVK